MTDPRPAPLALASLDAAVALLYARVDGPIVLAAPLGLGKPHRLLNAIYARAEADPSRPLTITTALSLDPPRAGAGLQARFLGPFLARHFGEDFPALAYVRAQKAGRLPAHVRVQEFYMQSGALLGNADAQREYASLNYTHAARGIAMRGANAVVQKVARGPDGRLSLSCNPDLTHDLLDLLAARGAERPLMIAEVDPRLPWLDGPCSVDPGFFDAVLDLPGPAPKLFALPRQPVSLAEHAIGLYASALVRDGGTLQIGIGALSDALCHALVLRHTRNAAWRAALEALRPGFLASRLVQREGGDAPFAEGLFGASEMVNDGFMQLAKAGILRRRVVDDLDAMARINAGATTPADAALLAREGHWLDGAFYLGSQALYDWLAALPPEQARGLRMTRISHVNQLYGGFEALERAQRRDARFFNTCMMATALGAAVSDALADGRVVSGVGGQYNFVAMAHALDDGRSVLMLRATRGDGAQRRSSVLWEYGHTTIPRHLRDLYVTEYGVADLRDAGDGDCVRAMLAITDAAFAPAVAARAAAAGKADAGDARHALDNTPARLAEVLGPLRRAGVLPAFPFGSDLDAGERRLATALKRLGARMAGGGAGRVAMLARAALAGGARDEGERAALARMGFDASPAGLRERLERGLLLVALRDGQAAGGDLDGDQSAD